MGEDFSFKNVRIFCQAYSNYLKHTCKCKIDEISIFVNYDTRFLSEEFAREAARIFSLNGIQTYMPERDAPLAAISLAMLEKKCCGAINFTASFNKPIFNGIKVFSRKGSPALPEETDAIETESEEVAKNFCHKPQYPDNKFISVVDVKPGYLKYLENIINFKLIKNSGIKIIVDNLYGTSREYLDYILTENDIESISIHNFPYSAFGGVISSCGKENLKDLSRLVISEKAHIGLATDIDGDRFGIVDSKGHFLSSNIIMPPLIEYLITVRKMEGGIVKSISTTNNIRAVAEYYFRKVHTTKIGFKYLAKALETHESFIAVESSNGAALNTNIKIKDGVLFSLLITEMLAYHRLDMDKLLKEFYSRFPRLYSNEIAISSNEKHIQRYNELLTQKSFDFGNLKVKKIDYVDGIKFRFPDSWLLIRKSGTNDVIRLYAESTGLKHTRHLMKVGRSFIE